MGPLKLFFFIKEFFNLAEYPDRKISDSISGIPPVSMGE